MEVKFSTQGTGACPLCIKRERCEILKKMGRVLSRKVRAKNDEVMEIVIYRCPEFEEYQYAEELAPFA